MSPHADVDMAPEMNGHHEYRSAADDPVPTPLAPVPIAIVGMSCRFSGNVTRPSQLWDLCAAGKDGWSPIPASRFDNKGLYHADHAKIGRNHVQGGFFMDEDVALFDAAFFNLASEVASSLDPQIRLLLETVYEATEDAGIPIEKLAGSDTSVYAGTFNKDYHEIQTKEPEVLPHSFLAGTGSAMLSNRVSHFYDLQGPSMSIDTGCSAGMVAVHQACQNLRSGESSLSIVGAASTLLGQDAFISASTIGAVGAEGKCFAWDDRAHGYGRGEGVAVLMLQPLDAALRDGNQIHAVIKESGLNQDGKTTTITSPSADAQVKLIRDCYKRAGLNLADTGYVEAHMTGTAAGDPIEAEAVAKTFGTAREANDPVIVGSVKTNLGHTEPVSGLAALIKTTYALKHKAIPPNLNYENTNPAIHLDAWHLKVPTSLTPWPQNKVLRASVNNFGYGGTNAHVILEPAPIEYVGAINGHQQLNGNESMNGNGHSNAVINHVETSLVYVLSAKDSTACTNMMHRLATHLSGSQPETEDLAYTLSQRRSLHAWRTAIRASNVDELAERLADPSRKAVQASKEPRLGFVFNGQGAQWHAMARELIAGYPIFGRRIREADDILKEYGASWSLMDELMRDAATTRVAAIHLSQPITVAIQLCLVDLLTSWKIHAHSVTSHSSGEIAAAYLANVLSFQEALGVAYYRGELALKHQKQHSLAGGMLAAAISSETAEAYIAKIPAGMGRVNVACINSPESVTLSGDMDALDEVIARLEQDGLFARKLKVPMAYHSHHMLHIEQDYIHKLQTILSPISPKTRWTHETIFYSPVTGKEVTSPSELGPEHWAHNMTNPVLFSEAFENMCDGIDMVVELGAHSTLAGPIRQILKARNIDLPYVSCLKRSVDAVETMQDLACELFSSGYPVALAEVNSISKTKGSRKARRMVTDLPSYPWNHTKRYWVEPRVSKEQRYKRFPPQELLGTPLNGSNGLTPTWRNFVRLEEAEWLKDHAIDGSVVFPGAGYIAMAIEAVRLLADASETTIKAYRLRDIDIMNAMIIAESSTGVETQLTLQPCNEKELDRDGWWEFRLCSLASGGNWIEHCKGYVSAEMADNARSKPSDLTRDVKPPGEDNFFQSDPFEQIDIESFFAGLRERGIYHGPEFQNLIDSRAAGPRAITNFKIAGLACREHDYVLHPTTLDSILQASFSSLPKDMDKDIMTLPRAIKSLYVPCSFDRQGGANLKAFTELVRSDKRGYTSDITVVGSAGEGDSPANILRIQEFFGQAVARRADSETEEFGICSKYCWELDVLHNFPEDMKKTLPIPLTDAEIDVEKQLLRATYYFLQDAVEELTASGVSDEDWEWHHKRMFDWMKTIIDQGKMGTLGAGSQTWYKASKGLRTMLYDQLNSTNASGRLTVRVGRNLAKIIRGDVLPLELMMEGNLLNQFYMDHQALKTRSYKHVAALAELYAVKNPGANVLEIGGGTGGATSSVLEAFSARSSDNRSVLGRYTFTDISAGFFEAARAKFETWSSFMDFKRLDIEVDPVEQSFEEHSYDLIVAASVLHATKSLETTMTHVRKLLKPGGTLLMIEATNDRLDGQLIFGTLPGWWLGEEPERQMSPHAPLSMWDRILRTTGFTGIDFDLPDYQEPEFGSARVILSRAATTIRGPISLVSSSVAEGTQDGARTSWLSQLADTIQTQTGVVPSLISLDDVESWQETICIFTDEMIKPFVHELDAAAFERLQQLLNLSAGLLWLSCGGSIDAADPTYAATYGLLRTMRQEDAGKRWISLDFEKDNEPWTDDKLGHIMHVLQQSFDPDLNPKDLEWEYAVKGSLLHVPRAYPDTSKHAVSSNLEVDQAPALELFEQSDRPLVWETPTSGAMGIDPYFVDNHDLIATPVPSGMVEIDPKAFGLNFREVMVALGELEEPFTGFECCGFVTNLGPDTEESGLKVGDRVAALVRGRIASRGRAWWTSVVKIPDGTNISNEEAASFPAVYVTSYASLIQIARLQRGESVLVHAAAGGTGQAAIVLAQSVGATVFATCSTNAKRDLLVQQYGLDPENIFSSRDDSFAPALMLKTGGKGVDVVLNSLSGHLLQATWRCVARFGRFVDITKMDIEANRRLETGPFGRCAVYTSFDLLQFTEFSGRLAHDALAQSMRIIGNRKAPPISPITSYFISEMATAMRQMQGGTHVGKLVLVPRPDDKVKVVTRAVPLSFEENATYLISGGLGGIGRAIARWMFTRGARHIVLVSRHASAHPDANSLRHEAASNDCELLIRDCDVSSESSLLALLKDFAALPPIRGAINGAMVLDDTVMERMTFDQWTNAVRPKINSSWNLHRHLPDMAFYIMLSSVAGVAGHMSQSNYAAGNTYQDALARYRTSKGQPAVTIDLGAVNSVGWVVDQEASGDDRIRKRVENVGFGPIEIEAVLAVIEEAIRHPLRASLDDCQVILGRNDNALAPESGMRDDRRFGTLRLASQRGLSSSSAQNNKSSTSAAALGRAISGATSLEQAAALLVGAMVPKVADIFSIPASDIDPELPLSRYGVDSLVAVELRNWISSSVKAKVSVFDILQSASLSEFAILVATKSELLASKNFGDAQNGTEQPVQ